MVKVGFIVEGDSEKIIVESTAFAQMLKDTGFELVHPVINAQGGGNLLPQNIGTFVSTLQQKQVENIIVLTDLENEASIDAVKHRIENEHVDVIIVAVKALEAWFLADTQAMRAWLKNDVFEELQPEQTADMPWDRLKEIAAQLNKRGPGNKVAFAKQMVKHHGFSIGNAAQHPNCPSARALTEYFEAENAN